MKCIYLIQSDNYNLPYTLPDGSQYLLLNWNLHSAKQEPPSKNEFYFPDSSWAEGRNELYRRACLIGEFEYFVFLDDDLELDFSVEYFESLLEKHHAARVAPNMSNHFYTGEPVDSAVTSIKYIDHCLMALSAEAAASLMPYSTEFDQTCWWHSSEEFCMRSWDEFRWQTYKLNELNVKNLQNRAYPKDYGSGLPTNEFAVV
jgi:hypothetical protein